MADSWTFSSRESKVREVNYSSFISGGRFNNFKMHCLEVWTESGDYFNVYRKNAKHFSKLSVGDTVRYTMKKENGKTKIKNFKIMIDEALVPALRSINFNSLAFIDIETVRGKKTLGPKKGDLFKSWEYKMRKTLDNPTDKELRATYIDKAALYAEFGKIVCITVGLPHGGNFVVKSFYGDDEKTIIQDFYKLMSKMLKRSDYIICGHSVLGFDLPFIFRRALINGVEIPRKMDFTWEKPWNLTERVFDIKDFWTSTGWYSSSLLNITHAMGLPSPKSNIDGSMVSDAYYNGKLEEVAQYCEKDVFAVYQIAQKLWNIKVSEDFISKEFDNDEEE